MKYILIFVPLFLAFSAASSIETAPTIIDALILAIMGFLCLFLVYLGIKMK